MKDAPRAADVSETPQRPRVLLVTDTLGNGGMERQLTLLAKSLAATWDVRVVSLTDGVYAPILREADIETDILERGFRLDVRPAIPLAGIIRDWKPSVVNTYGLMSLAAAMLPCRMRRIPLVDTSIRLGAVVTRQDRMVRRLNSHATVVIANSQAGLDAYGVDAERGRVVHNGFDPDRWTLCQDGQQLDWPTTVVMTARMHSHKDYRTLLDAARALGAEDPGGWRFLAVGWGDERTGLMSDYNDLVESGVAEFPEAGTEVLGVVRNANIGVLLTNQTNHAEGLSNSIMEYMACGLPVVCTDSGGNREIVVDGETGLIVAPSDTDAVVSSLRFLRDDPEAARRMGQAGRERIEKEFTVEALVAGTVAAYELAIARLR